MVSKIDGLGLVSGRKTSEAKKLVEQDFSIDTCTDFNLLNLMGVLYWQKKEDYASCISYL